MLIKKVVMLMCKLVMLLPSSWGSDTETQYCPTPACIKMGGMLSASMNNSVDPCTDFYQYACGGWIEANALPKGKSNSGILQKLISSTYVVLRSLLDDPTSAMGSAERKSQIYYTACMDRDKTIERLGAKPLLELLKKIGGWSIYGGFNLKKWNFQKIIQFLHVFEGKDGGILISWGVKENPHNSAQHIIVLKQGKLGLPARKYYHKKKIVNAYLKYMIEIGMLLGGQKNSTRTQMKKVLSFEKRLARIALPLSEAKDETKLQTSNVGYLNTLAPFLNWLQYLNFDFQRVGMSINATQKVVFKTKFIRKLSKLVLQYMSGTERKLVLSNYLAWGMVHSMVPYLSKPFRRALEKLKKAVGSSTSDKRKWMRCVKDTERAIGFGIGAMFVRKTFREESKYEIAQMFSEIRNAFIADLQTLKWMDKETSQFAKEKAEAIIDLIGYPSYILMSPQLDWQYEDLIFTANAYFQNKLNVKQFSILKALQNLNRPVNRNLWHSFPSTVNAEYVPKLNQLQIPAGFLQPPFYNSDNPAYLNFGGIGTVMGHELTHGFDNKGKDYDKYGSLRHWWQNTTLKNFKQKSQCFVNQYSQFIVDGSKLNGTLTLGENIADNGGLKTAFHAYQNWVRKNQPELPLPGMNLTSNQLFFLAFAHNLCSVSTQTSTNHKIELDIHSLNEFRVKGPLSNSEDFAHEFNCPIGSPMNPKSKCAIW